MAEIESGLHYPGNPGNRVRELRENKLMTQAQLARKAKVALRTIHSVEFWELNPSPTSCQPRQHQKAEAAHQTCGWFGNR